MFKIYDGRSYFYQWDLSQKLIIPQGCTEVHFRDGKHALRVAPYELDGVRVVDVPAKLLQKSRLISVYGYCEEDHSLHTCVSTKFYVKPRVKPADYFYDDVTPSEYESMKVRIEELESFIDGLTNFEEVAF